MLTGYVADQVRRSNRNLLIFNAIMLLICVAIPLISLPYIIECFRGPIPMTVKEIAALTSYKDVPHRYVKVAIDSENVDETTYHITGGNDHKDDRYFFVHVGATQFLIVKGHGKTLPDTVIGSLTDNSGDVTAKVLPGVEGHIDGGALPVVLETDSYTSGMYMEFFFCGIFGLLALWNIAKALIRRGDLLKHPSAKQLAYLGPPEEIAIAVDAEVQAGADKAGRDLVITQSWLLRPTYFGVTMVYLGDIAWLYKKQTKHKSYGVTTRTTFATVIHDVRGKVFEFPLSEAQVNGLLKELASRVPWAFVGFEAARDKAWRKQRKDVLATVEERKKAYLAEAAKAPPIQGGT